MKDEFYTKKTCDRCGKSLKGGRVMSMFNQDCICLECKKLEERDPRYNEALQAVQEEIKKGNLNFKGIGKK